MIELMVAMALSLILLLGVTQIFINNKKTFDIAHDLGMMQENGRVASSLITETIRYADYWRGVTANEVEYGPTTLSSAPTGCGASWVFDSDFPIRGYEGSATISSVVGLPSGCIISADYEANTDIIVVRYTDGRENSMYDDTEIADPSNADRYFVRSSVGESAYVFKGSDSSTATARIAYQPYVFNMEYGINIFFVRPCSIQVSGECKDDIPALVRLYLSGDTFQQEVLVEGVEQLQFEYGIDEDDDLDVDSYLTASAIADTASAWEQVVSVRISLISRSLQKDLDFDDSVNSDGSAKEYLMIGDMAAVGSGFNVPSDAKHYRRKLYQREIYVRNRGKL